jgi:hypothetical protein
MSTEIIRELPEILYKRTDGFIPPPPQPMKQPPSEYRHVLQYRFRWSPSTILDLYYACNVSQFLSLLKRNSELTEFEKQLVFYYMSFPPTTMKKKTSTKKKSGSRKGGQTHKRVSRRPVTVSLDSFWWFESLRKQYGGDTMLEQNALTDYNRCVLHDKHFFGSEAKRQETIEARSSTLPPLSSKLTTKSSPPNPSLDIWKSSLYNISRKMEELRSPVSMLFLSLEEKFPNIEFRDQLPETDQEVILKWMNERQALMDTLQNGLQEKSPNIKELKSIIANYKDTIVKDPQEQELILQWQYSTNQTFPTLQSWLYEIWKKYLKPSRLSPSEIQIQKLAKAIEQGKDFDGLHELIVASSSPSSSSLPKLCETVQGNQGGSGGIVLSLYDVYDTVYQAPFTTAELSQFDQLLLPMVQFFDADRFQTVEDIRRNFKKRDWITYPEIPFQNIIHTILRHVKISLLETFVHDEYLVQSPDIMDLIRQFDFFLIQVISEKHGWDPRIVKQIMEQVTIQLPPYSPPFAVEVSEMSSIDAIFDGTFSMEDEKCRDNNCLMTAYRFFSTSSSVSRTENAVITSDEELFYVLHKSHLLLNPATYIIKLFFLQIKEFFEGKLYDIVRSHILKPLKDIITTKYQERLSAVLKSLYRRNRVTVDVDHFPLPEFLKTPLAQNSAKSLQRKAYEYVSSNQNAWEERIMKEVTKLSVSYFEDFERMWKKDVEYVHPDDDATAGAVLMSDEGKAPVASMNDVGLTDDDAL